MIAKKISAILVIIMALSFITKNIVFAGAINTSNVVLTTSSFSGSLGTARNSSDSIQIIGCYSDTNSFISCYGSDNTGKSKVCTSSSNALISTLNEINSDSYLSVGFTGGECTYIKVSNFSSYRQKY